MNFNFIKEVSIRFMRLKIILLLGAFILLSGKVWADRDWLLTYPYETEEKGVFEIEQWYNAGDAIVESPQNQFEFEYGVTSRYTASIYIVRQTGNFQNLGWKFENRYRLAEPGKFVVDPAIYLEYNNNSPTGNPNELEGKIILQKNIGKLTFATNLVWEKTLGGNNTTIRFNRYHLAAAYPIIGQDIKGGLEFTRYAEDGITSLTPGIYANATEHFRILFGWEVPVSGLASSRIRTGLSYEFE